MNLLATLSIVTFLAAGAAFADAPRYVAIEVRSGEVFLEGQKLNRNTPISKYLEILGKPDRVASKANTIHIYDEFGILLYQQPGENSVKSISIELV